MPHSTTPHKCGSGPLKATQKGHKSNASRPEGGGSPATYMNEGFQVEESRGDAGKTLYRTPRAVRGCETQTNASEGG